MKTIALAFVGLVLLAQESKPTPTVEELQAQVTQLQQQIAAMQANIVASQKMFGACFQSLAEAEQRAAAKKP